MKRQFTRAELLGLEGQGRHATTAQDAPRHETAQEFPSVKNIYQDIYTAVALAGEWMTRAEIARAIGYKKASWLNPKIEELVERGYLIKYVEHAENGVSLPKFYYKVAR